MATILLIEEDDDARPVIRHNLRRAGYAVLVAVDEASARDWLEAGQARADLILVNLVGRPTEEAFAAARFMEKAREAERRSQLVRRAVFDHEHLSEEKVAEAADTV